jgi:ribosomal protein S18 acetylase RimI-like enzyme
MSSERIFLIASVDAVLVAEPTIESRAILDTDVRDVAQLVLDSYVGVSPEHKTLDDSVAKIESMMTGVIGEPRRECSRAVWFGSAPPVSAIFCTTWRGMPYIAELVTAPSSRSQGYASSLVREFAQMVQGEGGTHIGLMLKENNDAKRLFSELGFVEMFTPAGL